MKETSFDLQEMAMLVRELKDRQEIYDCVIGYCRGIDRLDGDTAHTESYFTFRSLNKTAPLYTNCCGRDLDRFERRDGRWAIAARVCLVEIRNEDWPPSGFEGDADYMSTLRTRTAPSYARPHDVIDSRITAS